MAKKVIKEIIITLLLCLAIILLLGLLLYDYVPMSKVIPEPVSYTTPEEVEEELLSADGVDESQIVMTYQIDSTDLSNYKKIQDYKPGKTNPFSSYETGTAGENTTNNNSSTGTASSGGTTSSDNSSTTTNNNSDNTSTSGGTYFQDKGTK